MILLGVLYICIAFINVLVLVIANSIINDNYRLYMSDARLDIGAILLAVFWPISLVCMVYILFYSMYKDSIKSKVEGHIMAATKDISYLDNLSTKELKAIKRAENIKAITMNDKIKSKIDSCILSREFEKNFL